MQEKSIRRYGKKELALERDGDVGNYNEFHVYDDGVHFYVQKINNILKQSRFKALKSHFEVKTIPFGPSHGLEWSWGWLSHSGPIEFSPGVPNQEYHMM